MTMTFYEFVETIANYKSAYEEPNFDFCRTRKTGTEWVLVNNDKHITITTHCDNEKEHNILQLMYEMHYGD